MKLSILYILKDDKPKGRMFNTVVKIVNALYVSLDEFRPAFHPS